LRIELTLMKGLIFDRLAIRLAPIDLVTFRGYLHHPQKGSINTLSDPTESSSTTFTDSLLDSGNNGVRVRPVLGTLVDLLDDDDLLSSLSSRKDDGDLAGLVDCR
jgi:hypothetical protein